jgi:hypothetical protein
MSGSGAYIPNLSTIATLSGGYYVLVCKGNNNNAQRASLEVLAEYVGETLNVDAVTTQYAAPSATGFSVEIDNADGGIWLILTPVAGYAAGTIVLPDSPVDQQTINVNCTQSVTTLTVNGNGNTVTGAPTTLAANAFFTLRYDETMSTWYRIG